MPWQTIFRTLGTSEGGVLDGLGRAIRSALGLGSGNGVDRAAFTAAVVALSAKLAKCDGITLKIEQETFERLFSFDAEEAANVRWLFGLAAQDVAGFEAYARTVSRSLADRPELKQDVYEALLHIASADGVMHQDEDRFLLTVAEIFGYSADEYRAFRARFVRDEADPYTVLGLTREMSGAAMKARYRELMRENHPDVIAGKGLSKDMQVIAERKVAIVNAAWDEIARERGL